MPRLLIGYAAALVGIMGMTALIRSIPGASHIANISMLYLLVVIALALGFGSGPAVAASVLAFFAFDWFFVEPHQTLTVKDPAEWIALVMFLVTALVTGHLTALLQDRADQARRRERETHALAEASWAVTSELDRDRALAELLRRLSDVVALRAAVISVPRSEGEPVRILPRGMEEAPAPEGEWEQVEAVLRTGEGLGWAHPARSPLPETGAAASHLPLMTESRVLGVLSLHWAPGHRTTPEERRVVVSLANQAALVLERDRLSHSETRARVLMEADRLKTALLSMVSHDFRSPLTSIKASVTGLLQEGAEWDPETQRELLHGIDQEADRLNGMVGNILALSRLEADAWRPQYEPTLVAELIGTALGSFSREENGRVVVHLDPGVPEVLLDPVQMVQVVRNLVDNALKYSPPEETVELHAGKGADTLILEVRDRGCGLSPHTEGRVFEPFFRAPELRESSVPGIGIGLAVCRGLVEAHGGRLTAENRPGGGSVFRLTLPLEVRP